MSTRAERVRTISMQMVWELTDLAAEGWYFRDDCRENAASDEMRHQRRARAIMLSNALNWPEYHGAIPYARLAL